VRKRLTPLDAFACDPLHARGRLAAA
jgi:hypothetical protein